MVKMFPWLLGFALVLTFKIVILIECFSSYHFDFIGVASIHWHTGTFHFGQELWDLHLI